MTNREFVDEAYRIVLRRAADAPGGEAAELTLQEGVQSRAGLVAAMVASAEFLGLRELEDAIVRARAGPVRDLSAPAGTDERSIEIPWVLSRSHDARRVLDIGYANAPNVYIDALAELDAEELVGVDLVEREVPGLRSVVADIRALPFADNSFDAVICVSTLEHIGCDNSVYGLASAQDPEGMLTALRELNRVTTFTGRILLSVPCGVNEHHGWFVQRPPSSWLRLFEDAALHVAEVEIYALGAQGWRVTDGDPDVRYGEKGPAASAVLCAALARSDE